MRQIVSNAGEEASVVVEQVKAEKGTVGYNAATGKYVDMVKEGILDPKKVTRTALQNAASIAGLMITTECMIADMPKGDSEGGSGAADMAGAMGGMGGMGGMM